VRVGTSNATLGGDPVVGFLRVHAEVKVNPALDLCTSPVGDAVGGRKEELLTGRTGAWTVLRDVITPSTA
jgi:hypothetical protein